MSKKISNIKMKNTWNGIENSRLPATPTPARSPFTPGWTSCPGHQSLALNLCLVRNAVSYPLGTLYAAARPGAVWAHSRPNHSVVFMKTKETR